MVWHFLDMLWFAGVGVLLVLALSFFLSSFSRLLLRFTLRGFALFCFALRCSARLCVVSLRVAWRCFAGTKAANLHL